MFILINYKYKDLFLKSHVDKQLRIATDDELFVATNEDINWENFELTESLCSDSELRFGSCESSMVKFQIRNAFIPLAGKWITITETLDGNTDEPFQYGRYKVFSDKPTADKEYRDIVAYDAMYEILNADVSGWYNKILLDKSGKVAMKQFRESFVRHFGLTEVLPKIGEDGSGNPIFGLANDSMSVEKTIETEEIGGKDVITAICEINGCFGHIGRDGKFHYIYLQQDTQGLYPADFLFPNHVPEQWDYLPQAETGNLYPQDPKGERMGAGQYIKCQYEDYVVRQINKVQIRQEENDIGATYPKKEPSNKDNSYIIQDNFLVYGKSTEELDIIAEKIYRKIKGIVYRPFDAECPGNPCFEVGDSLRFLTKYEIVESYIFSRTLKGIQKKIDSYSSKGFEKRSQNINGIQKSIIQLKGKASILTRTIEETRLEMYDIEAGLNNTIAITARDIRAELQDTASGISNAITITAGQIRAELQNEVDGLNNTIITTAGQIRTELEDTKKGLESSINQTAEQIRTEVSDRENNLQSQITQNAESISLRVVKGTVSSEISQEAGKISIEANRISISSDFFKLTEDGRITATAGTLGGININDNGIFSTNFNIKKDGTATFTEIDITSGKGAFSTGFGVSGTARDQFDSIVAANATIGNLIAQKIDASTVKADYMEVVNWTSAGYIKADRIAANSISADKLNLNGNPASWNNLSVVTDVTVNRDSKGNVIGVNVLKNNIWFLGVNNF